MNKDKDTRVRLRLRVRRERGLLLPSSILSIQLQNVCLSMHFVCAQHAHLIILTSHQLPASFQLTTPHTHARHAHTGARILDGLYKHARAHTHTPHNTLTRSCEKRKKRFIGL